MKNRQFLKNRQSTWIGLSAIATTALVVGWQLTGAFQSLELAALDQWFRLRPTETHENRIVLVTLTDHDLTQLGQFPLSDATLAKLLVKIKQQQPRVIGLDLYRNLPVEPGHQTLRDIYASTPNLIGIEKTLSGSNLPSVDPPPILRDRKQIAASDLVLDADGKIRRSLLSMRINSIWGSQSRTVETLGTRLALEYLKAEQIKPQKIAQTDGEIQLGKARLVPLKKSAGGYMNADVGGFQLLSNFRSLQNKFASASIIEVLQDKVPADWMRDRIVLIGSTAESLNDRFFTPYTVNPKTVSSGVEIHADLTSQLISAALNGRPLLRGIPDGLELIWIFLWAEAGAICGVRLRAWRHLIWLIPTVIGAIAGVYGLFLLGWWVTIIAPIAAGAIAALSTRGYMTWSALTRSHQLLKEYAQTLEQQVQERTYELTQQNCALIQAKQEAEAADRAKSTFLANVNHELRTPLSIILSTSELLSYDSSLTTKQKERLTTINRSVQHLLDLINNVLELAKLEAKAEAPTATELSLRQLLENLDQMFRPQAAEKGLKLIFHCAEDLPEQIEADERKLRQVLINLLNNAIKFTQAGAISVRVRWSPDAVDANCLLRFEVQDSGVGIATSELESVFKAFSQTESGRKSGQGSGLGLSISYQLVQLLGGELKVCSAAGAGALFWFDLPLAQLESSAISASLRSRNFSTYSDPK